ncbi:MAG: hypothetical protein QOE45_2690 [Frankiaceae bacterium]|nr:hypothetical protein [Frankiaceae bacterium]
MTNGGTEQPGDAYGVLRLDIEGGWTAAEMGELFTTLHSAYRAACAARVIRPAVRFGILQVGVDDYVAGLVQGGRARYGDLLVHSMRHESPGWIGLLGALNPLGTIERTFLARGEQRLQRDRDRAAEDLAREELRLREERQRMTFVLGMVDRLETLPPDIRDAVLGRLVGMWPQDGLERLATDARVTAVALQPVVVPAR